MTIVIVIAGEAVVFDEQCYPVDPRELTLDVNLAKHKPKFKPI